MPPRRRSHRIGRTYCPQCATCGRCIEAAVMPSGANDTSPIILYSYTIDSDTHAMAFDQYLLLNSPFATVGAPIVSGDTVYTMSTIYVEETDNFIVFLNKFWQLVFNFCVILFSCNKEIIEVVTTFSFLSSEL